MIQPVLALIAFLSFTRARPPTPEFDVVVYGGTSGGVIAAVQAKRLGKTVVVVGPDTHLGGLSSGGLGFTDTGNKAVIGGLSREFSHRVWRHYQEPGAWRWQKREEYGNKGQGTPAIDGEQRTMWIVSSSHIAFGSIRMEPVFMVLAHSAATAAALAIIAGWPSRTCPTPRCASGC